MRTSWPAACARLELAALRLELLALMMKNRGSEYITLYMKQSSYVCPSR